MACCDLESVPKYVFVLHSLTNPLTRICTPVEEKPSLTVAMVVLKSFADSPCGSAMPASHNSSKSLNLFRNRLLGSMLSTTCCNDQSREPLAKPCSVRSERQTLKKQRFGNVSAPDTPPGRLRCCKLAKIHRRFGVRCGVRTTLSRDSPARRACTAIDGWHQVGVSLAGAATVSPSAPGCQTSGGTAPWRARARVSGGRQTHP